MLIGVKGMEFKLTGQELVNFHEWNDQHKLNCEMNNTIGAIGGRLTFSFTPTGLGTAIKVQCVCGDEKDCTDIDCW